MSTRSNIFVDFDGERKQFYHHYDGYLDGVGADLLVKLRSVTEKVFSESSCYENLERKVYEEFLKTLKADKGYEPEEIGLHGDIEYLYYVKINERGVADEISFTETSWEKLGDEKYMEALEKAECGEHKISLVVKVD